ncbi:MAG: PspA/IM30 family protein [Myxococcota bacterium]|nr:PspA/IM30 family protein [Myxococcota bacterium]
MSDFRRPRTLNRLRSLVRGFFGRWVREREQQSPQIVYEQAIDERVRQYRELKEAVAGILFMRNKLEEEINDRRVEIARMHDDVRRAVRSGRDEISLGLIGQKQALFEDLERSEKELTTVRDQAEEAKANLIRFREEIRSLVREKGRMLATLANAKARRRLRVAIEGLSVDAEMDALESVREHISRMAMEGDLSQEVGEDALAMRQRLRAFRDEGRMESARSELEQLKREWASHTLSAEGIHRVKGSARTAPAA